jgi:hypothetical protein
MKRALSSMFFAGAVTMSFAQSSFTIVRPLDGSTIREMTKVLVPVSSVPRQGYIGVFIDGKFVEATVPKKSKDGKMFEYMLDTKSLTEGSHKLELKLYVDYNSQPRVTDTTSVDVIVGNVKGIEVPEDGIKMRYAFNVGLERIYKLQTKEVTSMISETDQKNTASRPFEFSEEGESITLLYSVDNRYNNGEGLVRMQVVPDRGVKNREFAFLTTTGSSEPQRFYPENMAPIYMRITPTGREIFGAVPDYFGFESTGTGAGSRVGLYASFPLPVLPTKSIKIGDSWQTLIQQGALNMEKIHTVNSVTRKISDGRGEFLRVEWEMGRRCAVIKNSISMGKTAPTRSAANAAEGMDVSKISMEETIWFDIDNGVIVKFFRDQTVEGKADFGAVAGGGGAAGPSASGPSPAGPSGPGGARGGTRSPDDFRLSPAVPNFQKGGPPTGGPGGPGGPRGGPSGPGGFGPQGPGRQGAPTGAGQESNAGFVKVRQQMLFVLQK